MPTSKPKIYTICVLILLSGTALSVGFFLSLKNSDDLKRDQILSNLYGNIHSNIQSEIDRNLNSLYALRASYHAFGGWDRAKFGNYASYYTKQIQSIQALEWVPEVSQSQRDSFELAAQNEGFDNFEIFTKEGDKTVRAETRPYYYPVYFIEPFKGNEAAFGFDPGPSNSNRQDAINLAIRTNEAAGSDVITIIQKTTPHQAILVFVPIFSNDKDIGLIGLIEGVYLVDRLVEAALQNLDLPREVNLVIFDQNKVLWGKPAKEAKVPHTRKGSLSIADSIWYIHLEYTSDMTSYVISPFWLLVAALIFTMLIVKVVYDVLSDNRVELQNHINELKNKNNDLEQYTYAASHDLQEPLHSMQGLVDLVQQDYFEELDEKGRTYLSHMKGASHRMSELIVNLIQYSKIGQAEQRMWTDSRTLINKVIKNLEPVIQEKQASIVINTELPVLMAYTSSLEQLIYHLIANGLKFQATNSQPKIEISATRGKDKNWQFAIKDNGIGFSEKYSERIFTIFRTLHSRSIYPGTGFGLANCKKIVELHNGRIWVSSSLGNGSTFYFTLNLT